MSAAAALPERDEPWLARRAMGWLLGGAVVAAFLIRALWIWRYGHVIENEGTAYARLAQSLARGEGYVGVLGDRHTLMPPLYPYLMLLLGPLAGSVELAGRWVSCVAGAAMIWPAYLIARALAGPRAGLIAAGLFASHGLAMGFSGATYGEGTFFFLLFSATALLLHSLERQDRRAWVATGVVYGLAYLVRPETIAYLALAVVYVMVCHRWERRPLLPAATRSLWLVIACCVVVAPYVVWLSSNSGHFRLEGKSDSNGLVNERMGAGMSYEEASRGLTADLAPAGPDLIANQFTIPRPGQSGLLLAAATVFHDPVSRGLQALRLWAQDPSCGGMLLALLGLCGIFSAFVWPRRNIPVAILFLCMTAGYLGLILSVRWFTWDRYIYPLTFFMLIWAAAGISALVDAGARLPVFQDGSRRLQIASRFLIMGGLVAAVSYVSLPARYAPMFYQSHDVWAEALQAAGSWINAQGGQRPVVMGVTAVVPYYAQGDLTYLPWLPEKEGERALEFIHRRDPDYVVLRTAEQWAVPYTGSWLEQGIPDACASEVYRAPEAPGQIVIVFRWSCEVPKNGEPS